MIRFALAAIVSSTLAAPATADLNNRVRVTGGQTSVALNFDALSAAAGLDLSSVSDAVILEGEIEGSVAFSINPRRAHDDLLPTRFRYDLGLFLDSFRGSIEHEGSVLFNHDAIEVGNFTIGFDADRAGTLDGNASGFFVESTVGVEAVLFDVANPSGLSPAGDRLLIEADLLVSPEFAGLLLDLGLAHTDLSGVDVGDALVNGDTRCSGANTTDSNGVDFFDFRRYIFTYIVDAPAADFNGDGVRTPDDFFAFLATFAECR
ncbi:MAG: hypothetical protein AAGH71_01025 [Planctomycetota bacterium]